MIVWLSEKTILTIVSVLDRDIIVGRISQSVRDGKFIERMCQSPEKLTSNRGYVKSL